MMNEEKKDFTPIGALGEFGLIHDITKGIHTSHVSTLKGIGDDAAVLGSESQKLVISTDLLIEGVHFDLRYYPLKQLGYKAVSVNVSDIYAMNVFPSQITVSLGISSKFSVQAIQEIYAGIQAACDEHEVDIVGGDTTANPHGLVISITAMGWASSSQICYRHTAKEGDFICVTGDLGAAYMGLMLLEREKHVFLANPDAQPEFGGREYLVRRQLRPRARKDIIESFKSNEIKPTSMIDVSDGVASDIMHIAHNSGLGAKIVEEWLPVHQDTKLQSLDFAIDPTTAALNGGEDYELLFTIDPTHQDALDGIKGVTVIGEMHHKDKGIVLQTNSGKLHKIEAQGFQHFEKS